MQSRKRHFGAITRTPYLAVTGAQLKFEYLGEFLVQLENMQRSAAWGIAYPKGFVPDEGGGDGGGDGDGEGEL
jgi:hypothetical protein